MKRLTPKGLLGSVGLAHMLYLYGYGLIHCPVGTAFAALVWIIITLQFWPEERKP